MPYTAEISRANPTCFLFLIDQSGSMADPFGGGADKKNPMGSPTPSTGCCRGLCCLIPRASWCSTVSMSASSATVPEWRQPWEGRG